MLRSGLYYDTEKDEYKKEHNKRVKISRGTKVGREQSTLPNSLVFLTPRAMQRPRYAPFQTAPSAREVYAADEDAGRVTLHRGVYPERPLPQPMTRLDGLVNWRGRSECIHL